MDSVGVSFRLAIEAAQSGCLKQLRLQDGVTQCGRITRRDRDFLKFTGVADTVAEIIVQAKRKPVSIGISGAWGVGKSSMIRLVRKSLERRPETKKGKPRREFVFVEFNAWLYQGYDDARAALLDVIGTVLLEEAETRQTGH